MRTVVLGPGERLKPAQLTRKGVLPADVVSAARDIVATVRAEGDAALSRYARDLDGVELESMRLPDEALAHALEAVERAAAQIRAFHERELTQSWFTTRPDGTLLGVKVTPVAAAGIYVPGGRAQYPSTVLMNAIPAKVAGVRRVVMVTPPQRDAAPGACPISPYTLPPCRPTPWQPRASRGWTRSIWWAVRRPWPPLRMAPRPCPAST